MVLPKLRVEAAGSNVLIALVDNEEVDVVCGFDDRRAGREKETVGVFVVDESVDVLLGASWCPLECGGDDDEEVPFVPNAMHIESKETCERREKPHLTSLPQHY